MEDWPVAVAVALAGAVGGLVNALITDKGFKMWYYDKPADGPAVFYPGSFGNALVGAVGAVATWGLNSVGIEERSSGSLWGAVAAAIIVGAGGSRILTDASTHILRRAVKKNLEDAGIGDSLEDGSPLDAEEDS